MGLIFLLITVLLIIPLGISALIAGSVNKKLVKTGNKRPRLLTAVVFIGSFIIIFAAIVIVISYNIRIER